MKLNWNFLGMEGGGKQETCGGSMLDEKKFFCTFQRSPHHFYMGIPLSPGTGQSIKKCNFISISPVSPGGQLLTKEPEGSRYEIRENLCMYWRVQLL